MIKLGRYRHYKGGEYEVFGVAKNAETEEEMVVYRALYGEREFWVRPLNIFSGEVEVDGIKKPRFVHLEE